MKGTFVVVTEPESEPVDVATAKTYLRVDGTDDDSLVIGLIMAAREWCEDYQNRAYITQTLEMTMDEFPHRSYLNRYVEGPFWGMEPYQMQHHHHHHHEIKLFRPPVQTVESIIYTDSTGTATTLDPTTYIVDTATEPARIVPAYGQNWPTVQLQPIAGIKIRYVAGYGTAADVPQSAKQAMMMLMDHWYNNRSAVGTVGGEVAFAVKSLLSKQRVVNT